MSERFIWYAVPDKANAFETTTSRLGIAALAREGRAWVLRYGPATAPTVVVIGWNVERIAKARASDILRSATQAVRA